MVYGIVEGRDGTIDVDTAPDEGTEVRICFPTCASRAISKEAASPPAGPDPAEAGETILLAEDEPSVRRMSRRVLEGHGYRVLVAADGEEALSILDSNGAEPVDLLVSDVVMPGISGHELGARVRRILPTIRAIFMSGYTETRAHPEEFDDDDAVFLSKPFSSQTLVRKVREMLAR